MFKEKMQLSIQSGCIQTFFPAGLDWWDNDSLPCTFPTVLVANSLTFAFTWSWKHAIVVPTCSFHVNAVEEKKKIWKVVLLSRSNMCRQMHLCTYYNPLFQGNCKYPSSQKLLLYFWIVSRRNSHCVFLPSCPVLACHPHCSWHILRLQHAFSSLLIHTNSC